MPNTSSQTILGRTKACFRYAQLAHPVTIATCYARSLGHMRDSTCARNCQGAIFPKSEIPTALLVKPASCRCRVGTSKSQSLRCTANQRSSSAKSGHGLSTGQRRRFLLQDCMLHCVLPALSSSPDRLFRHLPAMNRSSGMDLSDNHLLRWCRALGSIYDVRLNLQGRS